MRVLADTSVWIDHFHRPDPKLQTLLVSGQVWTHPVVIGELAAGRLARREEVLLHLQKLPRADDIDLAEGLHLLETRRIFGRGLSWPDVQLLAAATIDHFALWSRDRALARVAAELGLGYAGQT
jgi:predicted nucleic acid-binding protein